MAEWNLNPSWTPKEQINGGQQFSPNDILSPEDFNALVENMQYLYMNEGDFDVSNYPVGSIYMSVNSISPASLFGGSWERIQDKFLLAAGSSYSAGTTGGSATHYHTLESAYAKIYTGGLPGLTTGERGIAQASVSLSTDKAYAANRAYYGSGATTNYSYADPAVVTGTKLGGNTDRADNLPPYLAIYVWKRTA